MKARIVKTQLNDLMHFLREQGLKLGIKEQDLDQIEIETASNIRFIFPSHTSQLELIRRITKKVAAIADTFSEEELEDIGLAIDEACTNVIAHSYKRSEDAVISVGIDLESDRITIELTDRGKGGQEFNPENLPLVDKETYLNRLTKGGLGVYLIKKIMDEVKYTVSPGVSNSLIMVKYASSRK